MYNLDPNYKFNHNLVGNENKKLNLLKKESAQSVSSIVPNKLKKYFLKSKSNIFLPEIEGGSSKDLKNKGYFGLNHNLGNNAYNANN